MITDKSLAITGIGSLPHATLDAALEFAFRFDLPFLPQIPMRRPQEFMLPQALDGLPGAELKSGGLVQIQLGSWLKGKDLFSERLDHAFQKAEIDPTAFESFLPTSSSYSCWAPFLWELGERKMTQAKIQITGPLTSQWSLPPTDHAQEIHTQILRLILAKSIAMGRALIQRGVKPILFLDEPALYGLSPSQPKHLLGIQELKVVIQTLKKESIEVGLHCCSNTDWDVLYGLGLDYLALDTQLSLSVALKNRSSVEDFHHSGGRFVFGAVPTQTSLKSWDHSVAESLASQILDEFSQYHPSIRTDILSRALLSPACGLALLTPEDAEHVLTLLHDVRTTLKHMAAS